MKNQNQVNNLLFINKLLLTFWGCFSASLVHAQYSSTAKSMPVNVTQSNMYKYQSSSLQTALQDSTKHYGGFIINARWMPLISESGTVSLFYVDESPSRDQFSAKKTIDKSNYKLGFDLGIETGYKDGRHIEFTLGGMSQKLTRRFYAQIGLGHNFSFLKKDRITIRPVLAVSLGNIKYSLGSMRQNATYIHVNDKLFYSEQVSVSVRSNPLAVTPRVDLVVNISKRLSARLQGGYHLTVWKSKPFVHFSGQDEEKNSIVAREDITAENVNLRVNNDQIQNLPVGLDGLFGSFGVTYHFK